ncbi:MAG TPA: hypothetical protein VMN56_12295 [Casimicrobiaceae bacterium]|nr:hypothetical protein [Casimicrobiaceae bacterium]
MDGITFNAVSRTGIPFGSIGFRALVGFTEQSGRWVLAMSPVGRLTPSLDSDLSNNPLVLANADPTVSGTWQAYSAVGMGDADNESLFSLTAYNGWLYAGTMNEVSGAQVWKSRGCAAVGRNGCTPSWTKVLDRGGGRPPTSGGIVGNMGVSDLVGFGGAVYVGLTESALSGNFVEAELMRIRSDDTIEVLVGEPRLGTGTNAALPLNLRCGLPLEDIDHDGAANDCPPTTRRGAGYGAPGDATSGYPSGTQLYFWRLYPYARPDRARVLGVRRGDDQDVRHARQWDLHVLCRRPRRGGQRRGAGCRQPPDVFGERARSSAERHHRGRAVEPRHQRGRVLCVDRQR